MVTGKLKERLMVQGLSYTLSTDKAGLLVRGIMQKNLKIFLPANH